LTRRWRRCFSGFGESAAARFDCVAEGDLVAQEERPHPDTGETYYVAWFDMFRMQDGRIIEHWDTASKVELPAAMQQA
jgi:predicted SnoaL-like aldol condensation-catalyzing enzyme